MNYFIAKNGQQSGPYTEEQLRQVVSAGLVGPGDLCWCSGMAGWAPFSQVFGGTLGAVCPPPPAPAGGQAQAAPAQAVYQQAVVPGFAAGTPYAGFWLRVGACIIDGIVVQLCSMVVGGVIGGAMGGSGASVGDIQSVAMWVPAFVGWLYFALCESGAKQATPGKRICGLRVASVDGQRVSFGQASGRYFGKILSVLILFIGFLMCIWTQRKQCLHDMMSGCVILKNN